MRATGIIRRVDDLGRIVIPKSIREQLSIEAGEPLELFIESEKQMVCFQKVNEETVVERSLKADLRRILDRYEYDLSPAEQAAIENMMRRVRDGNKE